MKHLIATAASIALTASAIAQTPNNKPQSSGTSQSTATLTFSRNHTIQPPTNPSSTAGNTQPTGPSKTNTLTFSRDHTITIPKTTKTSTVTPTNTATLSFSRNTTITSVIPKGNTK